MERIYPTFSGIKLPRIARINPDPCVYVLRSKNAFMDSLVGGTHRWSADSVISWYVSSHDWRIHHSRVHRSYKSVIRVLIWTMSWNQGSQWVRNQNRRFSGSVYWFRNSNRFSQGSKILHMLRIKIMADKISHRPHRQNGIIGRKIRSVFVIFSHILFYSVFSYIRISPKYINLLNGIWLDTWFPLLGQFLWTVIWTAGYQPSKHVLANASKVAECLILITCLSKLKISSQIWNMYTGASGIPASHFS